MAHQPRHLHEVRRRAGPGHRRLGAHRQRRAAARPARDRRAGRTRRRGPRRLLDHAAEGQPRAVGADPPRCADRPRPRGPAAPRRCEQRRRATRRRLAHRVVDAGHAVAAHPDRRVAGHRAARRAARRHRQDGRRGQAAVLGPARRAAQPGQPVRHGARAGLRPQPLPRRDRSGDRRDPRPRPPTRRSREHSHRSPPSGSPAPPTGPSCRCWCSAPRSARRPRRCGPSAPPGSPTSSTWWPGTCPGTATTTPCPRSRSRWPSSPQGVLRVVDEILEQRDQYRGSFAYAGDSVGGCVGLQLLLDHPGRVTSAVLLCTGARIGERGDVGRPDRPGQRLRHVGDGLRLRRALVRARVPRPRARDRVGPAARAAGRRRPGLHPGLRGAGRVRRARPPR